MIELILVRIRFSSEQLSRLANILDNAGQVVLGTVVLGPFVSGGLDRLSLFMIILGLSLILLLWTGSLVLEKGANL